MTFSYGVISVYYLLKFGFIVDRLPFVFSTITYPFSLYDLIQLNNIPSDDNPYSMAIELTEWLSRSTLFMISSLREDE